MRPTMPPMLLIYPHFQDTLESLGVLVRAAIRRQWLRSPPAGDRDWSWHRFGTPVVTGIHREGWLACQKRFPTEVHALEAALLAYAVPDAERFGFQADVSRGILTLGGKRVLWRSWSHPEVSNDLFIVGDSDSSIRIEARFPEAVAMVLDALTPGDRTNEAPSAEKIRLCVQGITGIDMLPAPAPEEVPVIPNEQPIRLSLKDEVLARPLAEEAELHEEARIRGWEKGSNDCWQRRRHPEKLWETMLLDRYFPPSFSRVQAGVTEKAEQARAKVGWFTPDGRVFTPQNREKYREALDHALSISIVEDCAAHGYRLGGAILNAPPKWLRYLFLAVKKGVLTAEELSFGPPPETVGDLPPGGRILDRESVLLEAHLRGWLRSPDGEWSRLTSAHAPNGPWCPALWRNKDGRWLRYDRVLGEPHTAEIVSYNPERDEIDQIDLMLSQHAAEDAERLGVLTKEQAAGMAPIAIRKAIMAKLEQAAGGVSPPDTSPASGLAKESKPPEVSEEVGWFMIQREAELRSWRREGPGRWVRSIPGAYGASSMTWTPDENTIAYHGPRDGTGPRPVVTVNFSGNRDLIEWGILDILLTEEAITDAERLGLSQIAKDHREDPETARKVLLYARAANARQRAEELEKVAYTLGVSWSGVEERVGKLITRQMAADMAEKDLRRMTMPAGARLVDLPNLRSLTSLARQLSNELFNGHQVLDGHVDRVLPPAAGEELREGQPLPDLLIFQRIEALLSQKAELEKQLAEVQAGATRLTVERDQWKAVVEATMRAAKIPENGHGGLAEHVRKMAEAQRAILDEVNGSYREEDYITVEEVPDLIGELREKIDGYRFMGGDTIPDEVRERLARLFRRAVFYTTEPPGSGIPVSLLGPLHEILKPLGLDRWLPDVSARLGGWAFCTTGDSPLWVAETAPDNQEKK